MEMLQWIAIQLTPVGLLVGFVTGAVLSWLARGDWDGIEKGDDEGTTFDDCPYRKFCAKEDAKR